MDKQLDAWTRVLGSYAGRDKAIRTAYFLLQLHAQKVADGDEKRAAQWRGLAKQLSGARLVMRQLNQLSMNRAAFQWLKTRGRAVDEVDNTLTGAVTLIYTAYGWVELAAWFADAGILRNVDSARLFKLCLQLWLFALAAGIIRLVRQIYRRGLDRSKEEVISLVGLLGDFISGIHSLPPGFLWSGKLSPRVNATSSLIASAIGLYKLF